MEHDQLKLMNPNICQNSNYCGVLDIDWYDVLDQVEVKDDQFILTGICKAIDLPIRQRDDGYAVMIFDKESGREFWGHCHPVTAIVKMRLGSKAKWNTKEVYGDVDKFFEIIKEENQL